MVLSNIGSRFANLNFFYQLQYFTLQNFIAAEERDLKLVDAPVSGGVKRAADGTLTVRIYCTLSFHIIERNRIWLFTFPFIYLFYFWC